MENSGGHKKQKLRCLINHLLYLIKFKLFSSFVKPVFNLQE
jgi:hypothetical protein